MAQEILNPIFNLKKTLMDAIKNIESGCILFQFKFYRHKPIFVYLNGENQQIWPAKYYLRNGEIQPKFWHTLNNLDTENVKLKRRDVEEEFRKKAFICCREIRGKRFSRSTTKKGPHKRRRRSSWKTPS